MPKHKESWSKKITNVVSFVKIIMFEISPGFNQTKIKVKKKNNYDVWWE